MSETSAAGSQLSPENDTPDPAIPLEGLNQYEWVNGDVFAAGLGGATTVQGAKPIVVTGFSRLVETRGAAYAFLPSVSAVQFIAGI